MPTRDDLLDRHEAVSLMDDPLGFEQLVTRYDDEVSRTRPDGSYSSRSSMIVPVQS
ncbi:MAG TPA: hypothetical protein VFS38_06905 [Actinomycetota bacterium]|nr:hypothetical protein [Actinomycetota bacterium]